MPSIASNSMKFPAHLQTANNHFAGFKHQRKKRMKQIPNKLVSAKEENYLISLQALGDKKANFKDRVDKLYELRSTHGVTLDISPSLKFIQTEALKYTVFVKNKMIRFVPLEVMKHENGFKQSFMKFPVLK